MITFHGGEKSVWEAIQKRTGPKTQILAAIAYLTDPDALCLKAGDVLICNLSRKALATGSSNPRVAYDFAVDGVEIRSHDFLHAKVILAGRYLFVGSMNVSDNSVRLLDEGAIETTDKTAHFDAFSWIQGLRQALKPLSPGDIEKLFPLYHKPKGGLGGGKKKKAPETGGKRWHQKIYYWPTLPDLHTPSDKADEILEAGPEDERLAGYECYCYSMSLKSKRKIKKGDLIINNDQEVKRGEVWPAAEVWHVEKIGKKRYFFTASPTSDAMRSMTWKAFKKLAEDSGIKPFTSADWVRTVPPSVATKIKDAWPKSKPSQKK